MSGLVLDVQRDFTYPGPFYLYPLQLKQPNKLLRLQSTGKNEDKGTRTYSVA